MLAYWSLTKVMKKRKCHQYYTIGHSRDKSLSLLSPFKSYEKIKIKGHIFTTFYILGNLRMATYANMLIYIKLVTLAKDKHPILLGPFGSCKENKVS